MPRRPRIDLGCYVYHVINRSNNRVKIFHNDEDYKDFEYLLSELVETFDMRILAYVIMPNHWHLLLYPRNDGDLSKSLQWLGTAHARRHHTRKGTIGGGHLYQGRYKSFLIEKDEHLLTVLKYIERNPVRAKLSAHPQNWKWGSAIKRLSNKKVKLLAELPVDLPDNYLEWIDRPEKSEELNEIHHSIQKDVPCGEVLF